MIPLVAYLAGHDGRFRYLAEKFDFLHWFYAALMWGRYSGSAESKLNADVGVLGEEGAPTSYVTSSCRNVAESRSSRAISNDEAPVRPYTR